MVCNATQSNCQWFRLFASIPPIAFCVFGFRLATNKTMESQVLRVQAFYIL